MTTAEFNALIEQRDARLEAIKRDFAADLAAAHKMLRGSALLARKIEIHEAMGREVKGAWVTFEDVVFA